MESSVCFLQTTVVILILVYHHQTCEATISNNNQTNCPPSSCGKIRNIKHPFRLKNDPATCGDPRYELSCENNITTLTLLSGKYYVKSVNYNNYTIRVVDPGIREDDCSSIPRYFFTATNFTSYYNNSYRRFRFDNPAWFQYITYLNCSKPVKDDPDYVDTAPCRVNWDSNSAGHVYAIARRMSARRLNIDCHVKLVAMSSAPAFISQDDLQPFSYAEIHGMLSYGFDLSWVRRACEDFCDLNRQQCFLQFPTTGALECITDDCITPLGYPISCERMSKLRTLVEDIILGIVKGPDALTGMNKFRDRSSNSSVYKVGIVTGRYVLPYITIRIMLGVILLSVLLIYTYRRRHASIYENIEDFLQGNTLMPIRYSYKEIKKMTKGFKVKLGEGGYGDVYRGKLISGPFVAIKMLKIKSKTNGQEFISEVATIGRIYHSNVVRLIGFCVQGSKRALVYEYMPNGSLDKYIFNKQDVIYLTYNQIYEISLGVARGISYLHQGCDMQILHFDIKPHNILLDENFVPKVSDFGLAKLYPIDKSIATLTAARGTIGYMAPELFYQNIGGISHKADVYSFGMLLIEMASRRRNLNTHAEHSSQLYFPFWIYDQLSKNGEREMEDVIMEEINDVLKKMFVVALWCIQLKPIDRPSMNKVVEMLEGDIENIEMPPKPLLYPHETVQENLDSNSNETESDTGSTSYVEEIASNPLLKYSA